MANVSIRIADSDDDIKACYSVLHELRPHLARDSFLPTIRQMQRGGYFLVMLATDGQVAAVAGYRFSEHLARGKFLYIDDFVTAQVLRRHGYGQNLFDWLLEVAKLSGCASVHLDSGVQRHEAHLFYEQQNMKFSSRHYSLTLNLE